jgi:hypothetical protein
LATGILNAGIEKEIIDSFKDNSNLRLLEDALLKLIIRKNIFSKDKEVSVLPTWILGKVCSDLLCNDHTHQRMKSLFKTLFLPPNELITKISSPPFARISCFFYPFFRLIQVLSKSIGILMKAVFHKTGVSFAD